LGVGAALAGVTTEQAEAWVRSGQIRTQVIRKTRFLSLDDLDALAGGASDPTCGPAGREGKP
jgi:hypothetical protein